MNRDVVEEHQRAGVLVKVLAAVLLRDLQGHNPKAGLGTETWARVPARLFTSHMGMGLA